MELKMFSVEYNSLNGVIEFQKVAYINLPEITFSKLPNKRQSTRKSISTWPQTFLAISPTCRKISPIAFHLLHLIIIKQTAHF